MGIIPELKEKVGLVAPHQTWATLQKRGPRYRAAWFITWSALLSSLIHAWSKKLAIYALQFTVGLPTVIWPHYYFTLSAFRALPHLEHVRPPHLEYFHISAIFQRGKKIGCKKRIPYNLKNSEWLKLDCQIFSGLTPLRSMKLLTSVEHKRGSKCRLQSCSVSTFLKTNAYSNTNTYIYKYKYEYKYRYK